MADANDGRGTIEPPFYPIIYVRGYAGTDDEVEDTVSDPYMGFNLGSTRLRQTWTGETRRHYFESPVVRLMKDYRYRDVYSAGLDMGPIEELSPRSIIIYRYYDLVSTVFGHGEQIKMETFAQGLSDLVIKVRDRLCVDDRDRRRFKVHLVGHSMGGLVIRAFLQNAKNGSDEARALVDKVFTYATPHNGIEFEILGNVPSFFTRNSADNFNRKRMCEYLGLPKNTEPVRTLNGKFDVDRFFCLVGTNAKDYAVARGWSSRVVGPMSDGLVRVNNAMVAGGSPGGPERLAPRAYVHRSHSGYYGIVNSEEGYQNLTRFLFGDARVDGALEIAALTLPEEVQAKKDAGAKLRASYNFECIASVRGAAWDLSRRVVGENSSILRKFDDLFPPGRLPKGRVDKRVPELFTAFLSSRARVDPSRPSLGFSIDLRVLVPEYEVDDVLWLRDHFPGGYLFRDKVNLEAFPPTDGQPSWRLLHGFDSSTPNRATVDTPGVETPAGLEFRIPIVQRTQPGIEATLVLHARPWNAGAGDEPPQTVPVSG